MFCIYNPGIHLTCPQGNPLNLYDMCMALGRINRFNGNSECNVAEHSMNVASRAWNLTRERFRRAPRGWRGACQAAYIQGLVHDLHECIVGDITRPMKAASKGAVDTLEERVAGFVREQLGLPRELSPLVKQADDEVGAEEYEDYIVHRQAYHGRRSAQAGSDLYWTLQSHGINFKGQACQS